MGGWAPYSRRAGFACSRIFGSPRPPRLHPSAARYTGGRGGGSGRGAGVLYGGRGLGGACCAAAGSIHMTCQPWPSRSEKLREYRKPWSSGPSAPVPPAASAASATVPTSARAGTLKQYSASACVAGSAIGSFATCANVSWLSSMTDACPPASMQAAVSPVNTGLKLNPEPREERLAALDVRHGDIHQQHAASVRGSGHGRSAVRGPVVYAGIDRPSPQNSPVVPDQPPLAPSQRRARQTRPGSPASGATMPSGPAARRVPPVSDRAARARPLTPTGDTGHRAETGRS